MKTHHTVNLAVVVRQCFYLFVVQCKTVSYICIVHEFSYFRVGSEMIVSHLHTLLIPSVMSQLSHWIIVVVYATFRYSKPFVNSSEADVLCPN